MAIDFSAGDVLEHVQLNNMVLAANGWGVLDGLAVSQRSAGATMGVDVASGNAFIGDTKYNEASTVQLSIDAAHATLYRKDLITYDPTTGNPLVTKGTNHAGGTSDPIYPPDIPSGDILLAIVDVDANTSTIVDADIHDARALVTREVAVTVSASDTIRDSDDTEETIDWTTYTKIKELVVAGFIKSGTLRIKFDMMATAQPGDTSYGQIYRNGVAVGIERSVTGSSYSTFSEDIAGWSGHDTIELWVKYVLYKGTVINFRVYCDQTIIDPRGTDTW
ncbi:MAG: hypothetical protein U9Q37_04615 [Euryarchaeota archaeon]|nr:hypothetical protein [Euryarchaeota archaeon]